MSSTRRFLCFGLSLILWLVAAGPVLAAESYSAAEARAELDALYRGLQDAHFDLYAHRPRAEYDNYHRRLRDGFDAPVPHATLERRLQRFVAYGRVAHARIDLSDADWQSYRDDGGRIFPLLLRVVDGHAYVSADFSSREEITPGDRVLAIEGREPIAWLQPLRASLSADNDYLAYTLMESQLPKLVWRARGAVPRFAIEIEHAGERHALELDAAAPAAVSEGLAARKADGWDRREARRLDDGIAYLHPGPFYNAEGDAESTWDARGFVAFVDAAFEDFLAHDARALLIDLRDNPGGDNSFSDPMLAWIAHEPFRFCSRFRVKSSAAARASNLRRLTPGDTTSVTARFEAAYAAHAPGEVFDFEIESTPPREGRRFEGRVYLLVNRHSFSNTVLVAAIAQDYGFGRVLGEETSDLASTYGAMESFTLERSGLTVGFPKARIVRPSGVSEARGVVPDVAIATPLLEGPDDPVLQRALAIVREESRSK